MKKLLGYIIMLKIVFMSAQDVPPIQVFSPKDYGAEDQNWSISQAENKTIYIANNKGLLEYNGARWTLYQSPEKTIMRSVEVIADKVYTGSYMDFGFWKRDSFGVLVYTSLSEKLDLQLIEDEEFWNIQNIQNWILFQSLDRIYIYNTLNESVNIIDSKTRITKIFEVDDDIYFQKLNEGIFKIENGKEVLEIDKEPLVDFEVVNIFKDANGLLIQTTENGFYNFNNGEIGQWEISANSELFNISVYNSIKLTDDTFVFGTISNGIIQMDAEGFIVQKIDQVKGLSNNTVLSLYEDTSNNLWLGLDNGINLVNLNSPYRVYRDNQGILGTVYASTVFNSKLYLGTNQGLFSKPIDGVENFTFIRGTKGQVWNLDIIDGTLFCSHDKGTFVVNDGNVQQISNIKGTWGVKKIPGFDDILIQGNYKGLSILEKTDGQSWKLRNKIEGIDISSRYFEFISSKELLVSHEYKGVYRLELNDEFKALNHYEKIDIDKGIHSSITKYKDDILYAFENGIYRYSENLKGFKKDSTLSNLYNRSTFISGKLIYNDTSEKLWLFSEDKIIYIEPGKLSEKPEIKSIFLPSYIRKSKPGYEYILPLENNRYLLGNTQGYLIFDLDKVSSKMYTIKLNTAAHNTFSIDPDPLPLVVENKILFENNKNNVNFAYSVANFNSLIPTQYQYRLVGLYDEWSSWTTRSEIGFANLPFGDYQFQVRAKVGDIMTENELNYAFSIGKPWYLKPLAIASYILGFLLVAFFIQFLNRSYYKQQKLVEIQKKEKQLEIKALENQRELVEIKNQSLRQDIDNKNRELGISTMSLIKKNDLLNSIKNELSSAQELKDIKAVIKLINKNLNTSDDWRLFEEAFNNADKDFLKRIKALHSSLTSNDLRLCAYLRLNLSSKEIAPLLNISHRSVEVKRYRLRKKMDLSHEINLTDYILEI